MEIRHLTQSDLSPDMLKDFERHQNVTRCWRREESEWALKDIAYITDWDDEKKRSIVKSFARCIETGGAVVAAVENGRILGFTSVDPRRFGSEWQYVDMELLHITRAARGMGLGKKLFFEACAAARKIGARKLYISAHSAEESMAFYRKIGCVDAVEVNQLIAKSEPCDCQLEYDLYPS